MSKTNTILLRDISTSLCLITGALNGLAVYITNLYLFEFSFKFAVISGLVITGLQFLTNLIIRNTQIAKVKDET